MIQAFTQPARWYHFLIFFLLAFAIRALVFNTYLQHNDRYWQSDSPSYHQAALCIAYTNTMTALDGRPIFWRTPGYPWYLSLFINPTKKQPHHDEHRYADEYKRALWVQLTLCSIIPMLAYALAMTLTGMYPIAWATAIISCIHTGFVLASGYLLTDALAHIFFVLFLLAFYQSFSLFGESRRSQQSPLMLLLIAACMLAIFTWIRPMGQFVALFSAGLLLFSQENMRKKLMNIAVFLMLFFALLAPWFYRNYQLTGQTFFCPLFGLYFNVFNAPKILSRVADMPLADAHKHLTYSAGLVTGREYHKRAQEGSSRAICGELICLKTSLPLLLAHPFYFMYDWCVEVCKTTFDLYAYQLVALHHNIFKWDPLVEYLPEKLKETLYAKELPLFMRLLAWLEFFFALFLWTGIFWGIMRYIFKPLFSQKITKPELTALWIKTGVMVIAVVAQTGGFGYARLRLPIELLLIIVGLTFWYTKNRK